MNNRQSKWLSLGHDLFMPESATKFNNLILLVKNTYDLIKEAKLIDRRIYMLAITFQLISSIYY